MRRYACALTAAAALMPGSLCHADTIVTPQSPTTADSVRISVSGEASNPCFNLSSSHVVEGGTIHVYVRLTPLEGPCVQVLEAWQVTEEVGPLAAGDYDVLATVDVPCCFPCGADSCEEQSFLQVRPGSPREAVSAATCAADCNDDGGVTVDEVLVLVNIALGNVDTSRCAAGDSNLDDEITVEEILRAVSNALGGCLPPVPMGTGTPTPTPTPSPTPVQTSPGPISLSGTYAGRGEIQYTGCFDDLAAELVEVSIRVLDQRDTGLSGTISFLVEGGHSLLGEFSGTVDSPGRVSASFTVSGVGRLEGHFSGQLTGNSLHLQYAGVYDQFCLVSGEMTVRRVL